MPSARADTQANAIPILFNMLFLPFKVVFGPKISGIHAVRGNPERPENHLDRSSRFELPVRERDYSSRPAVSIAFAGQACFGTRSVSLAGEVEFKLEQCSFPSLRYNSPKLVHFSPRQKEAYICQWNPRLPPKN